MKVSKEGLGCHSNKSKLPDTLDLSKRNLHCITEDLFHSTPNLQNLHLESNFLCSIPENLFLQLQNLVWLDLRYNKIICLPPTIGNLRNLKYLLLEGNPIKALPVELGNLSTLKALNLRHCPLDFPPEDVVHQGLDSILSFLRNARTEDCLSSEPDDLKMPAIEKLQLEELKSSLDLSECGNEEERIQFEILRNKIIKQEEMEEIAQNQAFRLQSVPHRTRIKTRAQKGVFITKSRYSVHTEESKALRHAEEAERLAAIHQRQRAQEALKEWQKQTKLMKHNRKNNHSEVPAAVPPYATDLDSHQSKENSDKKKTHAAEKREMTPRGASAKSMRDIRVENRIRQHIQSMQERKRNPRGTAQEQLEAAKKDLEVATLLHAEVLQQKRETGNPLEYRFTAFTGDISPRPSTQTKPQNIMRETIS
uniref:Leucine rich repeat containing 27 n=1 Tax=Leptobrachium leishanense TaxID=445787 RepID=A0A8C5QVZ1_9ANUR